jgi:phospholipase/lecithinase/hemolysin
MHLSGNNPFRHAFFACATIAVCAGAAGAAPFSQLMIFGDSLSDIGNIASATADLFPGPYYYNDRFSNGQVYVETLAEGLGFDALAPSTNGGSVFAYGGAQTRLTGGISGIFIRDIDEQVTQFLDTRTFDTTALFVVAAGANDFVNGQTNANLPAVYLADEIERLAAAGARNFLVPNLPLLGHAPRYNDNPTTFAQYNQRSVQFNAALAAELDNIEANDPAITIFRLDVAALFSEALADPGRFGLTNVTDAAAPGLAPGDSSYDTNQIAPNADEYLFWDDLHPTATVHAILGERALALFQMPVPEPHPAAQIWIAFASILALRRRKPRVKRQFPSTLPDSLTN